ncbi:hypothetical protein, partial [Kineococcus esterisolvens]|uniref:hypothetical protein n=2 Tax=Kineococcus TaxID=33981 RepID=UPI003D7D737C
AAPQRRTRTHRTRTTAPPHPLPAPPNWRDGALVRFATTMSWQIREGLDQHLAMALYVRDAAGLQRYVVTEPDVGALAPAVPAPAGSGHHLTPDEDDVGADVGADVDLSQAVREWPIWWARALHQVPLTQPPTTPEELREAAPPAPPDWHGLQDLPAMRTLAERHHHDIRHWLREIKHNEIERCRGRRGSSDPLHLTHFVNAYAQRLGRRVRPFTLHLRLLPLQQPAGWVLDEQQVLLSTALREDADALERLLEPVVSALA